MNTGRNRWKCHTCDRSGDGARDDAYAVRALAEHCASREHLLAVVRHHDLEAERARESADLHAKYAEQARERLARLERGS